MLDCDFSGDKSLSDVKQAGWWWLEDQDFILKIIFILIFVWLESTL